MTDSEHDKQPLHLFEGYGVELEYMIVDSATLDVRPVSDELIRAVNGVIASDVEFGDIAWSNELVLHVIEVKTNGPSPTLRGLEPRFQEHVQRINAALSPLGARLMPSAMHPWMNPNHEMKLWPHDFSPVYEAFNRIFDCRGHGWANLQSVHLNLPFASDAEFARLHAAIRLILPLLPGLAASSPVMDGRLTGLLDTRLDVYRTNSQKIPSVAGRVIPERAWSEAEYDQVIFQPMFAAIAPYDAEGVLQDEFLNARGAIARFSRGAIEIRVLDIQECPAADFAVLNSVVAVLRSLVAERWTTSLRQQCVDVEPLERILLATIRDGEDAVINEGLVGEAGYLRHFGWTGGPRCRVKDLWQYLCDATQVATTLDPGPKVALDTILQQGPLARRLVKALGRDPSHEHTVSVYAQLSDCLQEGRMFSP